MKLNDKNIEALLNLLAQTEDTELTCDECLREMAEFAEQALLGKSPTDGQSVIAHHLKICPECREEFEALLRALDGWEEAEA